MNNIINKELILENSIRFGFSQYSKAKEIENELMRLNPGSQGRRELFKNPRPKVLPGIKGKGQVMLSPLAVIQVRKMLKEFPKDYRLSVEMMFYTLENSNSIVSMADRKKEETKGQSSKRLIQKKKSYSSSGLKKIEHGNFDYEKMDKKEMVASSISQYAYEIKKAGQSIRGIFTPISRGIFILGIDDKRTMMYFFKNLREALILFGYNKILNENTSVILYNSAEGFIKNFKKHLTN